MLFVYMISGFAFLLTDFILNIVNLINNNSLGKPIWRHFFRLNPMFCLGESVLILGLPENFRYFFTGLGVPVSDVLGLDLIGYNLIYSGIFGVFWFLLILLFEYIKLFNIKVWPDCLFVEFPIHENVDEDVAAERKRIENEEVKEEMITLRGLSKQFGLNPRGPHIFAVNDVWFSIPKGQCFGFLGVNGAGKTTTLKMLSGDIRPSKGTALINKADIFKNPIEVRKSIGYCPQFDALHKLMTAEEVLAFYGRIRGIQENKISDMVNSLIKRLTLDNDGQHKRPCGTYSGGNLRKLSVAVALIGDPVVVFLDEPSTGVDPVSRRFMWDFICETMSSRAVILTTHSMEECEALCQRIGIISKGQMKCIGTSQHLKTRFGNGYQIDISVEKGKQKMMQNFIKTTFKNSVKLEGTDTGIHFKYRITKEMSLSDIFSCIEQQKQEIGITAYSVGQTTLEQIFLRFANSMPTADDTSIQVKTDMHTADQTSFLEEKEA
eukprot:TRINITY_DN411_c0_g3_i1.p1 TRINITY_DN411_c0_g3~~TRINITY_DN411_c0_g3_i1.p1  ORF type:complete len:528 (+),score=67.75 TRINITY_DN411_c0_g3_i1:109-1584(+)